MLCGQELLAAGQSQDGYAALQRASDLQPALTGRAQALMRVHRESWLDEQRVIVKRTDGA